VRVILPAPPGLFEQLRGLLRGDSGPELLRALFAAQLPELPALPWLPPLGGGIAYLPPDWLVLR
ncbi:MAG TPA: hypothetical protein VEN47_11650, partial [Myxococcota bacterium]|nr:hypothetical protein [Myxococcota bacterium]